MHKKCSKCAMERSFGRDIDGPRPSALYWRKDASSDWNKLTGNEPVPPCRGKAVSARPEVGYPEHEKLHAVSEKSQACGEFLEWLLTSQGYQIGEYHEHTDECWTDDGDDVGKRRTCGIHENFLYQASINVRKLLADFFQINEAKLEDEKRTMLKVLQEATLKSLDKPVPTKEGAQE